VIIGNAQIAHSQLTNQLQIN